MKRQEKGIPVFRPAFGDRELEALREVFESGWLGPGPKSLEFEQKFADFVGASHAVCVTSGTAALHLACQALGLGPGDEVLVPSLSFVSSAHAVTYCGAEVVFVDVDPETCTLDPEDLQRRITPRSRAVIPVHYGGHPCRMREVHSIADQHGLAVIEDAAHACGARYQDRPIGGLEGTSATCFSFNALKNLSTGDGGMVTTHSARLAEKIKKLRWLGIEKDTFERSAFANDQSFRPDNSKYEWYYEVQDLGFKYIMNDVVAAIGLIQLEGMPENQARRQQMAARYSKGLKSLPDLELPREQGWATSAWHLFAIKANQRESLRLFLQSRGIATSVHYYPLHLQPFYYKRRRVQLPACERLAGRLLTLPFHPNLTDQEVGRVIESVLDFVRTDSQKEII